jgi:predicted TIM-barrel fold metal-dependent hydrolase
MAGFEGSPISLRCALEVIKPDRLVFATDYPQNFNSSDPRQGRSIDGVREYIDEINRLPLDSHLKDGMLGATAARLLKLN